MKRIKVGIQTFFQNNYGAVLQAYALKSYIEESCSGDVEVINFTTDNHLKTFKVFNKNAGGNIATAIVKNIILFFRYGRIKRQYKRINSFKNKYLSLTRRYSSMEDMFNNMPEEDVYVTGSDQVFNPKSPYMPVYYLAFDKKGKKKVAYAPSFGISEFSKELTDKISGLLKDFDALSCREQVGADYMASIVGHPVPGVVDPVLLLDSNRWSKVAAPINLKYKYIFVYDRNGGNNLIKLAQRLSEETKLPIVVISADNCCLYKVKKRIFDAGPEEFIGYIKNAEYVVTDSFHGTMFSLIFGKQFYVYSAIPSLFSRIENVLSKLGMKDRIVRKGDLYSFQFMSSNKEVIIPNTFTQNSKTYLNGSIN